MMVQSVKNGEQRRLLIAQCRTLIYIIASLKQEHIEDIEENTCSDCSSILSSGELLAMLAEAVNESRDTILEFGGQLTANQPLEVCGVKAPGIGPIVWHLANRMLILVRSINGEGDLRPEAERLVHDYITKFYSDLDTEWLASELSIEAAQKSTVTTADDDDRCQWQLSEKEDLVAVLEQLPEGWVKMDDESRSRWVKEIPTVGGESLAGKLSTAKSPAEWATLFGLTARAFVRACKDGTIRHKKLTSKAYQVHVDDIPTTKR